MLVYINEVQILFHFFTMFYKDVIVLLFLDIKNSTSS